MRPTRAPRAIALARRADQPQPAAIFATLGLVTVLLLAWLGLVL